jgi:hypothetical protein
MRVRCLRNIECSSDSVLYMLRCFLLSVVQENDEYIAVKCGLFVHREELKLMVFEKRRRIFEPTREESRSHWPRGVIH